MISAATELKYVGQLKRELAGQFKQPAPEWVKFLTSRVYDGFFTQKVREQFTPLVEKAARQFLNDQVNERLKIALRDSEYEPVPVDDQVTVLPTEDAVPTEPGPDVLTTAQELDGFRVVQAIVCAEVSAARVAARDTKTYFGVLLDDNNRKPIARLWFNRSKKYLGVFDENKVETRVPIDEVEDIYRYADQLRKTVARYLRNGSQAAAPVAEG